MIKIKKQLLVGMEAYTYNPSYLGGRDQETVKKKQS
jgi:hypothetical protein